MKLNEFSSLSQLADEYSHDSGSVVSQYIGLDFEYKHECFRMCFEPIKQYYVYRVRDNGSGKMPTFETLGRYLNFQSLLDAKVIDNRPFSDVILDEKTIILGKD